MAQSSELANVALSIDFMDAFSRIPSREQTRVRAFIEKFRAAPFSNGINLEKVKQWKDPNLRSVRIDQTWRGVVFHPERGNLFILLWVDHHDEAYDWGTRRQCRVNLDTGSLQVFTVEKHAVMPLEEKKGSDNPASQTLFGALKEKDLRRIGVPSTWLDSVRGMACRADLEEARQELPHDAFEALSFLAEGIPLDEVLATFFTPDKRSTSPACPEAEHGEPERFLEALKTDTAKKYFHIVTDDKDLAAMLDAPLSQWRVFLHPAQRHLTEGCWSGPVRVIGSAGTGKSVVALHRAKHLALHVFTDPEDRILLTTFTKTLADDLRRQMASLCTPEAMARVDVSTLDTWVAEYLHRQNWPYQIAYGNMAKTPWETALRCAPEKPAYSPIFYRE